jgi:hypothetical protein
MMMKENDIECIFNFLKRLKKITRTRFIINPLDNILEKESY